MLKQHILSSIKALKVALRAGGAALGEVVSWFSPRTGIWIRYNSIKLADFLDTTVTWTENALASGIQKLGAPPDVAKEIAKFLVSLL
ncbi:hypothetical protein [Aneurinibacillus terranovensis]|uniref:hypothetical protein n=1 Tax=Aneurinibacillus terranovensis TaxID=278991 RepID=UPI000483DEC2|nr:hypothetical protein [Aneurinibacillus terranovensis]